MLKRSILFALALSPLLAHGLRAADCSENTAVQAMERAVKADSKNANNNFNLATAYYNNQCYDQAIDAFEHTLKLVKGEGASDKDLRFDALSTLGGLYFQARQDPGTAVKYFKQALELRPSDKFCLNGISMALVKDGKVEEGMGYLKKALLADPGNVQAHYRMAILLNQKLEGSKPVDEKLRGEVIKAFEDAARLAEKQEKSDEINNIRVTSYTRLGELYRDTQQSDLAVAALTKAIKLAPDDFNSRFILGQMYYNQKKYSDMIEQYKKAVEIDPKQKLARFNLGVAYINQEQFAEAFDQFKAITEIDPSDSEALALMGQTLERAVDQLLAQGTGKFTAENYVDAKVDFARVLELDPKNKTAHEYLDKTQTAIDKNFSTEMAKAKKALKAKKAEDAAEALEKALAMKPDDEEAKTLHSKTNFNIGKLVDRYLHKGDADFKRGDYEGAEREWKHAESFTKGKEKARVKLAKLAKLTTTEVAKAMKKAKAAEKSKNLVGMRNAYRAILAVSPGNVDAKNGLTKVNSQISDKVKKSVDKGRSLFEGGDKKGARTQFEAALKLDPTNSDANDYITRITGSQSNAKVNSERVKQLYYQGVDLYVNNKIKEAIKTWEELLALDPNHQDAAKNIQRAKAKLKALENL
jgi:tetratricopeptide (TPR) repeat protein